MHRSITLVLEEKEGVREYEQPTSNLPAQLRVQSLIKDTVSIQCYTNINKNKIKKCNTYRLSTQERLSIFCDRFSHEEKKNEPLAFVRFQVLT